MFKKNSNNCICHTIKCFGLDKVIVTDVFSVKALNTNIDYLLSLEPDKLVAEFYEMQWKNHRIYLWPN